MFKIHIWGTGEGTGDGKEFGKAKERLEFDDAMTTTATDLTLHRLTEMAGLVEKFLQKKVKIEPEGGKMSVQCVKRK
uniref:Uncharacterized protein n=1 Tax=Setaria digitata TaxID=48799 RepID=A0A915Q7A5_9BILA